MRIAVTGTHGSGKTTLIDDFLDGHRQYAHAQEPYWELAQEGLPFADGPTVDDLADQLQQSARLILASADRDMIFDRCPLDFIAYLDVVSEEEGDEWTPSGKLLARIEAALATLDLIVFLPLSRPDEIRTEIEYPTLRRAVDERLKLVLREDALGLLEDGPRIIEISGPPSARLAQLAAAIADDKGVSRRRGP
jgi:hypothetical protein